jgi:hypothetical protein
MLASRHKAATVGRARFRDQRSRLCDGRTDGSETSLSKRGAKVSLPATDNETRWVILFDSIHYVLAAERIFQEHKVWCDLVPVPRDLSSDCGMAVEFRRRDLPAVRSVLADPRVRLRRVYRPSSGGHEEVELSG